ncbi:hypothetical protein [Thalassotalea crassostreae]|uniref:hypothetical protein n=1 Tax=Thalassotalea crassostreae TaxID=1763536 RepID=UPI0008396172|nr:hypothetical protein [Thalassotalea crassostreae]
MSSKLKFCFLCTIFITKVSFGNGVCKDFDMLVNESEKLTTNFFSQGYKRMNKEVKFKAIDLKCNLSIESELNINNPLGVKLINFRQNIDCPMLTDIQIQKIKSSISKNQCENFTFEDRSDDDLYVLLRNKKYIPSLEFLKNTNNGRTIPAISIISGKYRSMYSPEIVVKKEINFGSKQYASKYNIEQWTQQRKIDSNYCGPIKTVLNNLIDNEYALLNGLGNENGNKYINEKEYSYRSLSSSRKDKTSQSRDTVFKLPNAKECKYSIDVEGQYENFDELKNAPLIEKSYRCKWLFGSAKNAQETLYDFGSMIDMCVVGNEELNYTLNISKYKKNKKTIEENFQKESKNKISVNAYGYELSTRKNSYELVFKFDFEPKKN